MTTVRQAFKEAGERSVDWLLGGEAAGRSELSQTRCPVTLVVRGSTAAPGGQAIDGQTLAQRLNELAVLAARLERR